MTKKEEDNKVAVKRKGGRPKGGRPTKGRMVRIENVGMENAIRLFINGNFKAATDSWRDIEDPARKFETFLKLMEFVIPKKRAIDFTPLDDADKSLESRLSKMLGKPEIIDIEDISTDVNNKP